MPDRAGMTPGQRDAALSSAARNAAATIRAIYEWLDMIEREGGCVTIPGIAKTHAMIKSLTENRARVGALILKPIDDATQEQGSKCK